MHRHAMVPVALAVAVLLLFGAVGTQAATGNETFRITFQGRSNPTSAPVIASGVVTGQGTDTTIASTPNPDGTVTDTDLITLPLGTITLADTLDMTTLTVNQPACVVTVTSHGHYTVVGGTGAYAAAAGQGTFTTRSTVVFRHSPTGCSSTIQTLVGTTTASGPLSV